jgi:hypothetical protein
MVLGWAAIFQRSHWQFSAAIPCDDASDVITGEHQIIASACHVADPTLMSREHRFFATGNLNAHDSGVTSASQQMPAVRRKDAGHERHLVLVLDDEFGFGWVDGHECEWFTPTRL